MNYRKPSYYEEFKCIAKDCPDTCCAGWEIVIDKDTMSRYQSMGGELGEYILSNVNKEEGVYKRCGNRCAFLNADNLCDLIIRAGEDKLCRTCDKYPRHFEEYGNLLESLISISCPVAAKMIIAREEKDSFSSYSDDKPPLSKDVDKKLLSCICDIRDTLFSLMTDRKDDINVRIKKILAVGEKVQPLIYQYEKLGIKKIVPFYKSNILKKVNKILADEEWFDIYAQHKEISFSANEQKKLMNSYMEMYVSLENINDKWPKMVEEVIDILYKDLSCEEYHCYKKEFDSYIKSMDYAYEHLLVYFVYVYVLGGVYDYNIQGMIKFSVISTLIIKEMCYAHWLKKDKNLSMDDLVNYAYLYSRQVEHSDNNVLCLEGIFTAHTSFRFEKIYGIL